MSPVIGAKVSDDTYQEIEDRREGDETRSETVRRLLRAGIEAEDHNDALEAFRFSFLVTGIVTTMLSLSGDRGPLFVVLSVSILITGVTLTYAPERIVDPLSRAEERIREYRND